MQKEECRMKKDGLNMESRRVGRCLAYRKMGSFFVTVSCAMRINHCGYNAIERHKMGSFGNILFLEGGGLTRIYTN